MEKGFKGEKFSFFLLLFSFLLFFFFPLSHFPLFFFLFFSFFFFSFLLLCFLFLGRVGSLGWAGEEDKQVKDLNGDFMYERGGQFANWVCIFSPIFFLSFFLHKITRFSISPFLSPFPLFFPLGGI